MRTTIQCVPGILLLAMSAILLTAACEPGPPTSDQVQRQQQETILKEGTAQVGMPAIKNFRERKIMKDVLEKRDQEGLVTYTYLFSEMRGCLVPLANSVGYPIPYSTQFTNPEKIETRGAEGITTTPQADPNGLFSPTSSEATWSIVKDPHGPNTGISYSEPKLLVWPFKVDESALCSKQ